MASTQRRSTGPFLARLLLATCALGVPASAFLPGGCKEFTAGPHDAGGGGAAGCGDGQALCGDSCVDPREDVDHCGACDHACPAVEGKRLCSGGVCQTLKCEGGRADCDESDANGCETDVLTDLAACGACKTPCAGRCVAGACDAPQQISAGADYTCAVLHGGSVYCWGRNTWGNLGDGTLSVDRLTPTPVEGLPGPATQVATGLSSGRTHTCAVIADDGSLYCWGAGNSGQLGDGNTANSPTPVRVKDLVDIAQVAVGGAHTCAVSRSGQLFCWGAGSVGQLGYGGEENQAAPTLILDGVRAVAAGASHTCALLGDGTVRCWGANGSGQLGNGSFQRQDAPASVVGSAGIGAIAVGAYHSCAAPLPGVTSCWGKGADFRLGTGTVSDEAAPRSIAALDGALSIALGAKHSGAVLADHTAVLWGDNIAGQLGNGTRDPALLPTPIDLADVAALALGDDHTCALTGAGEVLCWGDNGSGQLGNGTTTQHDLPAKVTWAAAP